MATAKVCKISNRSMLEGWDTIQRDLESLGEWALVGVVKFNKVKCKIVHIGQGNTWYQYRLWDKLMEGIIES